MRPFALFPVTLATFAMASALACSTTTSSAPDGAVSDATVDAPSTNACTAYGQGYVCQSGVSCSAGYVNEQDLDCNTGGDLCCGPAGEGGVDASNDVNVFVDSAVFETGGDGAKTKPADAGVDGAKTPSMDAGVDGGTHDAQADAKVDAVTDGSHGE